ncbi:hypothetical protein [Nostoc sp. CHAB 5715]|uniref:hypothetical protein n=1 Tax=Nostoc sp. CHAB 5715 TaxID=2780400 RepID=UPI001E3D5370|nr:hypothetical protein [Nostoc sp. CHAB 5715]MCC5620965.1 hypothetical protein [Nostoc sp. CHAB 5715]
MSNGAVSFTVSDRIGRVYSGSLETVKNLGVAEHWDELGQAGGRILEVAKSTPIGLTHALRILGVLGVLVNQRCRRVSRRRRLVNPKGGSIN